MTLFLILVWLFIASATSAGRGFGALLGALICVPLIGMFAYAALKALGGLVGIELP